IKYNPNYSVFLGIADKLNGRVDLTFFGPHQVIEIENLNLPEFREMKERYNLLELSCALKSFYAAYLFNNHKPEKVIYLDADILVFDAFTDAEEKLNRYSILL